ncbi:hypothetical protein H5T58_03105 [Candidatus Parcubacteria bacterium]|nr:hypothetical protein [Candidatus Parcubacteria bacterium]
MPTFKYLLVKAKSKTTLQIAGVIILAFLVFAGGYYLARKGYFHKLNLSQLATLVKTEEKETPAPTPEMPEIVIEPQLSQKETQAQQAPQSETKYEEIAQKGEGITHLARRALKRFLEEKGNALGIKLSPGQKLYVEDYLQKKIGGYWLFLGEKISFSEQLIKEAIDHALSLTPIQIEHLNQMAQAVPSLNY